MIFLLLILLLPLSSSDYFFGRYRFDHLLEPTDILKDYKGVGLDAGRLPVSDERARQILLDVDDKVPDKFAVTPYFAPDIRFWFGIYTQYDSSQIVLHDRDDLEVIYGVLHFKDSDVEGLNRFAKAAIMQSMAQRKIDDVKMHLRLLAKGETSSSLAQSILRVLQQSASPPPQKAALRAEYFNKRADGVRAQTGQRNFIGEGLKRALPILPYLQKIFFEADLPTELLAIALLESSFNNQAHSRVGALGVWQFMPLVASHFMPKRTSAIDYRQNPILSTVAAMQLLRENFTILKRWDLAVTAYNSGTRHLTAARRELNHPAPSLEAIFRFYSSKHHGFASKAFYSEFIALVHVLDYRVELFPDTQEPSATSIHMSVALCPFVPAAVASQQSTFAELNPHLYKHKSTYPRGTVVVSSAPLAPGRFKELNMDLIVRQRSKTWIDRVSAQSCSTK